MNDFTGRKLMFLDGSALAIPAINRAKSMGIHTIVANYYDRSISIGKQYADEAWDIDYTNTEATAKKMIESGVNGLFQGWTDSHLADYAALCEATGLSCY